MGNIGEMVDAQSVALKQGEKVCLGQPRTPQCGVAALRLRVPGELSGSPLTPTQQFITLEQLVEALQQVQ